MCGVSGILHESHDIIKNLYESIFNLQHRGQEASGIISFSNKNKKTYKLKEFGLVDNHLKNLPYIEGNMGIGHVRYPTSGDNTRKEIQPFYISKPYGISLVHNGNITNKQELKKLLESYNIYMNSSSDSEIILNLFYFYIEKDLKKLTDDNIINTLKKIYNICIGSFSVIIMINDYGLIGFRDKYGIRPLVYSKSEKGIMICSETIALENSQDYMNVENGEVIIVKKNMQIDKYRLENAEITPCLFEYIYFARPESYINDVLVYKFREKLGEKMGEIILKAIEDKQILDDIDIILPVPLTSLLSATTLAYKLNKPIKHAIIKNRYTHRTFINAEDNIIKSIKKIRIIKELVKDKNILIVDDSIVRGNTSKYIIDELKKAKVKKIYFACCCPPIRYPNIYGIAIPTYDELIAYNRTEDEIKEKLQIDKLYYLPMEIMCDVLKEINPKLNKFELSVFTGDYLPGNI